MLPDYSSILVTSALQDFTPVLCFCRSTLLILLVLVSIKLNSRIMLLCYWLGVYSAFTYTYSLNIVCLIPCHLFMYHYACLLNSRFLLAALVHFSCIFIAQFAFDFLFLFQNSDSAIVAIFLVHASSGGRLFCMVVSVW